jgi:apolipoprotein N-acyltransferase
MTGIALALLSGLLAAASAPPYRAWPLIFVAFVPMLLAQHRLLSPRWSPLAPGIAYGVWFASQLLPGLVEARVALVVQLLPLYAGLLVTALSWRTRRFSFATPLGWVALDFLRGSGIAVLGGTWGNPVYALWSQPWLLQPVSLTGIYGLELLILLVNWAIAGLLLLPRPRSFHAAGAVATGVVAWIGASVVLLNSAPATLRVAAIQPGPCNDAAEELRRDIEQTRQAAASGARLIVWREAGVRFDPRSHRTAEFAALARETAAHLVIGFADRLPDGRRLNMAAVFDSDGRLLGAYGKDHPGTFAGDFSDVQEGYPVWPTAIGRLAAIICYDLDFTDTARFMARAGAQIVAVPSNDPVPSLAETHYTHLVFRAIENRVSLIKADKMRDATAIDPWGRVVAKEVDKRGRRSTLVADLPLGTHDTLFVRLGDWAAFLCAAGWVALRLTRRAAP